MAALRVAGVCSENRQPLLGADYNPHLDRRTVVWREQIFSYQGRAVAAVATLERGLPSIRIK